VSLSKFEDFQVHYMIMIYYFEYLWV